VLYSGPPPGLRAVESSQTARYLFADTRRASPSGRAPRTPRSWLRLRGIVRNNLDRLDAEFPLGCFTAVTGADAAALLRAILPFSAASTEARARAACRSADSGMIRRSLADESACGDLSASAAGGAEVAAAGRDPPPGSFRAGRPAGPPLAV